MGNLCCAREHSVQFSMQFFYTVKLHSLTQCVWGPLLGRCAESPCTGYEPLSKGQSQSLHHLFFYKKKVSASHLRGMRNRFNATRRKSRSLCGFQLSLALKTEGSHVRVFATACVLVHVRDA